MDKKSRMSDVKRIIWVLWVGVAIVAFLLVRAYANAISTHVQLQQKLDEFEPALVSAKAEREELKERLIYVQSDTYVVQWSHEEARMTLPGETLVVTGHSPTSLPEESISNPESATTPVSMPELPDSDPATPIMRWWRAISGQH